MPNQEENFHERFASQLRGVRVTDVTDPGIGR